MELTDQEARVIQLLTEHTVLTFKALESRLQVSRRTIRRALRKHGYFASCNANRGYVTLRDTPRFDDEGIWTFRQACFAQHGSLRRTVLALVERSQAGKTADELQTQLHTHVHNHLSWLGRERKIDRFFLGHEAVYVSSKPDRAARQESQRRQTAPKAEEVPASPRQLPEGLSAPSVIQLLVQMIATPEDTPTSLARRLRSQGLSLTAQDVQRVIAFYALEKKTKR